MTNLTAIVRPNDSHTPSNRNILTFAAKYYLVYSSYFIIINAERVTGPGRKLPLLQLFFN